MIRFYSDEQVSGAVTKGLKKRGVELLTSPEAGTLGVKDEVHLERAYADARVLITQDADFLALHAAGHPHAGIVFAPQGTPVGEIIRGVMLLNEVFEPEDMFGQVEYL